MILILDNYDSFTYNLVQYIGMFSEDLIVHRNDAISVKEALSVSLSGLVVSPGPKKPCNAGISKELISGCMGKVPILGICLGHQAIGEVLGGQTIQSNEIIHGKSCAVYHQQQGILKNIPSPFIAGRYHSLILDPNSLPQQEVEIIATTENNQIMGIQAKKYKHVWGLQFHPESILTKEGLQIMKNFVLCTQSQDRE